MATTRKRRQWLRAGTEDDRKATFERQKTVMEMYSDNAKTYIQISGAALGLTLTFAHKILHIPESASIVNGWTVATWCCFLLTILAGAFYQYLAVKTLDALLEWEYEGFWDWLEPGIVYGIMLAAFYGGAILFTVYGISSLSGHS
jgi:hypothetical protein